MSYPNRGYTKSLLRLCGYRLHTLQRCSHVRRGQRQTLLASVRHQIPWITSANPTQRKAIRSCNASAPVQNAAQFWHKIEGNS
jgi:hypothetical protein